MKSAQVLLFIFSALFISIKAQQELLSHKKLFQAKLELSSNYNNALCQSQLAEFTQALSESQEWAVRLVDTWAKVGAGYLSGNIMNLGDFDSCVKFRHENFQGQHCWVTISALPNSTLESDSNDINLKKFANFLRNNNIQHVQNGFCLPESCSAENVIKFLNEEFLFKNDLIAYNAICRPNEIASLEPLDYFAIVLFSLIALLMIASTIYEIIMKQKRKETNRLYISFSVYTNGAKLFDVTKIKSASSLNCLHGLRAMSILWIILGHRFSNQHPQGNPKDYAEYAMKLSSSIVKAYPIAVDTFLVMGALLVAWSTLRDCEKENMNILRMIWRRYLRYTPVLAATMLVIICFSKYLFSGPYVFTSLKDSCVDSWWMVLLHIQNYLPQERLCVNHSWYLSVDFQLFLISPFIILLIHKFGKKLLLLPAILCLTSIIYALTMSFVFDMRYITADPGEGLEHYLRMIYYQTLPRSGPWFMGIILGYFVYKNRGKTIKINALINALFWILSLSGLISAVIFQHVLSISTDTTTLSNALFIALQRNVWAVGLCWIIFACQNIKTGGFIRWFLSLPQWQPISRMGLSMYITGAVYQVTMILNQRVPMFCVAWNVFPILWSDFVAIIILSTISYLALEVPPMLVEDYFYKKYQTSKKITDKSAKL
ncbi:hypothetical protein PVAND_013777 [Polypedilum vanderplanki]|uniref:Nose resistant-to-fluoxetine protein N-terminal domain-containing protein n=1 Tax=Polypedilum vanderplanki TaxID=319348 RepID=A0A9J6CRR8_POLVA|nr:hypothetical protein PVAND_013777 [Polypedilum vanderplanki]